MKTPFMGASVQKEYIPLLNRLQVCQRNSHDFDRLSKALHSAARERSLRGVPLTVVSPLATVATRAQISIAQSLYRLKILRFGETADSIKEKNTKFQML